MYTYTHTEDLGLILGLGRFPEGGRSPGGNGNHSSILAWKIPQTEEPSGLQSMGPWRVGHVRVTKQDMFYTYTHTHTHTHTLNFLSHQKAIYSKKSKRTEFQRRMSP